MTNAIDAAIKDDEAESLKAEFASCGRIGGIYASLCPTNDNLLGFVLNMNYEEGSVITCDAWKRKCGGLPKNSFVVIKLKDETHRSHSNVRIKPSIILARVVGTDDVPLSNEVKQTIFSIHKVQAIPDPYTSSELQWGAVKVSIIGTYWDKDKTNLEFGNDIDFFMSPHFYEVYVPSNEHLEMLINFFAEGASSMTIGQLKYTETQTIGLGQSIDVKVSPKDFVANRTALFGKTRMGKSNTIKVIADMMIKSNEKVGQVIFDLNGEYSNPTGMDKDTCLYVKNAEKCTRYSLYQSAAVGGSAPPKLLKVNFYDSIALGHMIINNLWELEWGRQQPAYMQPFFQWEAIDEADINDAIPDQGDRVRYRRALSMYRAVLHVAGYTSPKDYTVNLHFNKEVREYLATLNIPGAVVEKKPKGNDEVKETQTLEGAARIYAAIFNSDDFNNRNTPNSGSVFAPDSRSGKPYLDPPHVAFINILGNPAYAGTKYLMRFRRYHDLAGSDISKAVVSEVDACKTVIIDLSIADEKVANFFSEMICQAVFRSQTKKFTSNSLGDHSVLFYFEEAHNLFRKDDNDLTSIYNRLAKEGGKYKIGMVYATQSMTTLSPDLMKNTENFFIAHLNDDREVNELTKKYEFRDIGQDVQRSKTKGYVRMITLSQRYALPVQIKLFG